VQVGRHGRSVAEVAENLSCDWHTYLIEGRGWSAARVEDWFVDLAHAAISRA